MKRMERTSKLAIGLVIGILAAAAGVTTTTSRASMRQQPAASSSSARPLVTQAGTTLADGVVELGRWGKDDEKGTLNSKRRRRKAAAALVRTASRFRSLNVITERNRHGVPC